MGYGEFKAGWPVVLSSLLGIGLGLSPVPFYTIGILAPQLAKAFFLVARYFGMKSYGVLYGALYSFFSLGGGVGPVVFGAVFDRTHSYAVPLSASAVGMLVGALALLALGRYRDLSPVQGAQVLAAAEALADTRSV